MRRLVFPSVVLAACLAASCTGTEETPRSDSIPSSRPAADASDPPSAPSTPPPVVEKTEHSAYPLTTVDLQRLQAARVGTDGLPFGAPPHIAWSQPRGPRYVYRLGNEVIPIPGAFLPVGRFGDGYVAEGGCTRSREQCQGKPGNGVHLVSQDGAVTSLYLAAGGEQVCCLSISLDRRRLAWVVNTRSAHRPYRFALGDSMPTELPDPAAGTRGAFPGPVGFVGDDLILAVARSGREIGYVRTSGRPAEWDARYLRVVAPTALLGEPAFSRDRDTCLSRYPLNSPKPRWTRCYTWDGRPAELQVPSAPPEGRWLASIVTASSGLSQDLVLVDLRTGLPRHRIRFDHRLQKVRFEDESHFLVVLTREDLPGLDPWPVDRIVRCDLELDCERATPDIKILGYDMLGFMGE